jgi:arylsulfatase A-like enzyme
VRTWKSIGVMGLLAATISLSAAQALWAENKKPDIIFIMGDDIGWSNIGVYNQGIMAGRTPNLDRLANEGMRFTDYYAEASCTAGRANFITGELPIRTGLTTVGQAGAPLGMPDQAPTIATVLKSLGYATGQFGKNHLGDRNRSCPPSMASTSSSATCTTSMRWRTHAIATIRRRCETGSDPGT